MNRIAVDAMSLPHLATLILQDEDGTHAISALQKLCSGAPVGQLVLSERVRLTGPGWSIVSIDEADSLHERQRNELVPVRGMSSLAMIQTWSPEVLTMELLEDEGDSIAEVEVDFDFKTVKITHGTDTIFDGVATGNEFDDAWAALRKCMSVETPIKGIDVPTGPATPFSTRASPNAAPTTHVLPNWVGELAVRWLSHCVRLHVILHASLPNGIARPLALNGAYLTRIATNDRYSDDECERWRLSFIVHESSCRCFCNVWNHGHADSNRLCAPKKIVVTLDFCGKKKIDGFCTKHLETPGTVFRDPRALLDVCMRSASMTLSCRHAGANGGVVPTCPSQVKLPFSDSFAKSLMATARTLCDPGTTHTQADLDELRAFLDSSLSTTVAEYATMRSVGEDVMLERDQTVAAMLETKQFFVAAKRKHGPLVLQQRHVVQKTPSFLIEAMATHSHLLPSS